MYERLLREILRCTAKEHEGVAEAGHYLERAWKPMFEPLSSQSKPFQRPLLCVCFALRSLVADAFKCSGHYGQKKGDIACCNQTKLVRIELPWTICASLFIETI